MKRLIELTDLIDVPNRGRCMKIYWDNIELFDIAPGSSHNHQAWPGGYLDHVVETMNIAVVLYASLGKMRALPFTLSDALLVMFLHDLEKPWRHKSKIGLETKEQRKQFRASKIAQYEIEIAEQHQNALKYVEGEHEDYSSKRRVMNELAAFCHMCDVWSARGWHDYPLREREST